MKQNFILLSLIFGCVMCSCTSYKLYDDDLKKNIHRIGESGGASSTDPSEQMENMCDIGDVIANIGSEHNYMLDAVYEIVSNMPIASFLENYENNPNFIQSICLNCMAQAYSISPREDSAYYNLHFQNEIYDETNLNLIIFRQIKQAIQSNDIEYAFNTIDENLRGFINSGCEEEQKMAYFGQINLSIAQSSIQYWSSCKLEDWYAWSLNVKQYLAEQNGQDFNREDFELLPENRSRIINDIAQSDVTGAIVGIIGVGVAALIGIGTGQVLLASIAARYILYAAFSASASGALQYLLFN